MLFPYDTSLLHMVIHRDTINEYEIVKVVSLKSWGYCGADAGAKDYRGKKPANSRFVQGIGG